MKLLADYRDDLVVQRIRVCSQLRWHLHELDPELGILFRGLRRQCLQDQLAQRLADMPGVVAQIARELLERCCQLTARINQVESQLRQLVGVLASQLLAIPGCGVLGVATIIGETAGTVATPTAAPSLLRRGPSHLKADERTDRAHGDDCCNLEVHRRPLRHGSYLSYHRKRSLLLVAPYVMITPFSHIRSKGSE
ncbi:hypothetical protein [Nonomuraea sp. NPDC003709]|uniref:hypothetical protein n=1 Tax=Nonomuraea sp. NPDC003709 TaxID=3154450 RepID=UPI0033B6EE2E